MSGASGGSGRGGAAGGGGVSEGGEHSQEDEDAMEGKEAGDGVDMAKSCERWRWEGGMSTTTPAGPSPARVNHYAQARRLQKNGCTEIVPATHSKPK